jgi:hypothetical protein
MKKTILLVIVIGGAFAAQSQEKQSLKNLLFSGKLKKDSTGVIRSTDDLTAKIDTGSKKETQYAAVATNVPTANAQQDNNAVIPNTAQQVNNTVAAKTAVIPGVVANGGDTATNNTDTTAAVAAPVTTPPPKSNTRLLKEYTDSVVRALQDEALKSKQIKKNTYYLMLDYEIDTDGQVTFTNVTATPENSFLQAQVKQILDSTPLRLNPVTDSNNQAKKVKRKQQISVTKE